MLPKICCGVLSELYVEWERVGFNCETVRRIVFYIKKPVLGGLFECRLLQWGCGVRWIKLELWWSIVGL